MNFKDLLFFDKQGINYGFVYDETTNTWTGNIFIDDVSRGLFETQQIYLMQRFVVKAESDTVKNDQLINPIYTYEYGLPVVDTENGYFVFEFDDLVKDVNEINLFGIKETEVECEPEDTSALAYNEYNCPEPEFLTSVFVTDLTEDEVNISEIYVDETTNLYTQTYTHTPDITKDCKIINLCFCNTEDEYNTFRRDLKMYYVEGEGTEVTKTLVATLSVYAESIEEDERLSVMCKNLGYDISNVDFSIFKESDIKEQLINYELMNRKRKEILMEGSNIYTYIGSYKALVNAIRFFGYDNVAIKEWWKNVDVESPHFNKEFLATSYSLENNEVIKTDTNITLPSKKFRKTNKISLSYKINELTDQETGYEEHTYPQTKESFDYSVEEAVIKLYGLKRKLEKEFLPLNTHIVDIIGEADSFYVLNLNSTVSGNLSNDIKSGIKVDFEVLGGDENGEFYLEDLRPFGLFEVKDESIAGEGTIDDFGLQGLNQYNTNWASPESTPIQMTASEAGVESYERKPYDMVGSSLWGVYGKVDEPKWEYYDWWVTENEKKGNYYLANFSYYYPNLKYNSPVSPVLDLDSNEHLPDTLETAIPGALVRLNLIDSNVEKYSRVEWVVCKDGDDEPKFYISISGLISRGYNDIGIVLPYVGEYSVTVTVYDWNNSVSTKTKVSCIKVLPKNVEFMGWAVFMESTVNWLSNIPIDQLSFCTYDLPIYNSNTSSDLLTSFYEGVNRNDFIGEYIDEDDVDSSITNFTFTDKDGLLVENSTGPYFWNNLSCTYNEVEHLYWDATVISGDIPTYFEFGYFDENGDFVDSPDGNNDTMDGKFLEIVDEDNNYDVFYIQHTDPSSTPLTDIVNQLNSSNKPVISKFTYKWVYDEDYAEHVIDPDFNPDIPNGFKIIAVSKDMQYKIKYVGVVDGEHLAYKDRMNNLHIQKDPNNKQLRVHINQVTYNPTFSSIVLLNRFKSIPAYTDLNFSYTNCKISGKTSPHWIFTNLNTGTIYASNHKHFHRMFKERGCYEVKLELEDVNGNKYEGSRVMFKIV